MSTELLHQMMDKLVSIDSRLDGIDSRLDGIDSRLDGMDAKIDKLTEQQTKLESKLDGACEQIARNTEILETFFQPLAATVKKQALIVEDLVMKVDDHTTDIKLLKKLAVGM